MIPLPRPFLDRPIAHRAYHNSAQGRPENSRAAFQAAIDGKYGVECDVQLSSDGQAMVFHDDTLDRLTPAQGQVCAHSSTELGSIPLHNSSEKIPLLSEMLELVAGQVPLLIEVKDQDGQMGENVGPLEDAVAEDTKDYEGPVAVMSFNPHSVAILSGQITDRAVGLTTSSYDPNVWNTLSHDTCNRLRQIPDYDHVGASFISHEARDLARPRVRELKAQGACVLTWTVRSFSEELEARKIAHNITFEGYQAN